jgi:hypothetical protein
MQCSMACLNRFLHHLPTCWRQYSLSDSRQKPDAFVLVGAIKHVDAITRDCVIDSGIPVLFDEFKEFLAPRIIQIMEDLLAKFFQFFDTGSADRFRDRFAPLFCDCIDVDLIEWHGVSYFVGRIWLWARCSIQYLAPVVLNSKLDAVYQTSSDSPAEILTHYGSCT